MPGGFTSQTYSIQSILGRSSFPSHVAKRVVVPPFQRSYSWQKTHIATFWEDIRYFHETKQASETYFLGPIVVLPDEPALQIQLLDGQQRLATITVLLCAMRDIAREKGGQAGADLARDVQRDFILCEDEDDSWALTLNELDRIFFRDNVQKDPPTNKTPATVRSHRLINTTVL